MLDRTKAPPYTHSNQLNLPNPEIIRLDNNLSIYQISDFEQEVIKIEIIFEAGKWHESTPGIAHFTTHLLDKGTPAMNSAQIAEFFDQHGAFIEISSGMDYSSISLFSLNKNLEKVLPVFLDIINTSNFPEKEFVQLREDFLQSLKVNEQKTSYLASIALNRNVFGSSHPYGKRIEADSVQKFTIEDLIRFHRNHLLPSSIFIVGKIQNNMLKVLSNAFSKTNTKSASPPLVQPEATNPFREDINKKDSSQASLRMGKLSLLRNHEDYYDLLFLNHLLGGYFGSRLMKNIREEKGLTYGIYSTLNSFKQNSIFQIGADVNKDNIELVIDEIKKELKVLCKESISDKELSLARNHFFGNMQIDLASPFSVMEKIKKIQLFDLNKDFYQKLLDRITSFTDKTQLQIANKYFSDNSFSIVVAS